MVDNELQSTEGASPESSPSTPEQTAPTQTSSSGSEAAAEGKTTNSESSNAPFHEHPRWKELIEQRNQFQSEMQKMQQRLTEYEAKNRPAEVVQETPEQKMLKRLDTIDPEFSKLMRTMYDRVSKVDKLESGWQEQQAKAEREAVQSQLTSLHEQNKVPAEYRDLYKAMIKEKATEMGASVKDLPEVYKVVHGSISKMLDAVKRSERQSYVGDKTKDAAVPGSQARSAPAKPAPKPIQVPTDPEARKAAIVRQVMTDLRAQRESA